MANPTTCRLAGKVLFAAMVWLGCVSRVLAGNLGETLAISDQNYIATPAADGVKILLDVFDSESALRAVPAGDRPAIAETLARRTVDLYLKELDPADRAALRSADVTLVYFRQRDEYDRPMYSAMSEIGHVIALLLGGKIAKIDKATEMKF